MVKTKSRGSAGGFVPFVLQVHGEWGEGGWWLQGACSPRKFLKMQFPAFTGLELDEQESLLMHKQNCPQ